MIMLKKQTNQALLKFIFVFGIILVFTSNSNAKDMEEAITLLKEMGCGTCHSGINEKSEIINKTPDLSDTGLRYNAGYIYDYLLKPTRVRKHLKIPRMPDFHLNERESLALTMFLEKQTKLVGKWPKTPLNKEREIPDSVSGKQLITKRFLCTQCHKLEGQGNEISLDLATIGYRLNSDWVKLFIMHPARFQEEGLMPNFFYVPDKTNNSWRGLSQESSKHIKDVIRYLFSLNQNKRKELKEKYKEVKSEHSEITAKMGEKIYISQNCSGCHKHDSIKSMGFNAPDLSIEGSRVKKDWLQKYLLKTYSVRPFGYFPGFGGRMPDFQFTAKEVDIITKYLMEQKADWSQSIEIKQEPLSVFSYKKVHVYIKEKTSCLGCHKLGNEGGYIAPDLSSITERLQPTYIKHIIQKPQDISSEIIMPHVLLPQMYEERIIQFLLQQKIKQEKSAYLSLVDHPVMVNWSKDETETNYQKYCSTCHGIDGKADGYNSEYLPVTPTKFADTDYMGTRPNDTMFDGIFAGGYILNKHQYMPPWGDLFSHDEIRNLVAYMRKLCNCQSPAWSLDDLKR